MGFLKKVSNALFGSSGSKYNQDQGAMTSQYGVQSSIGNMNVIKNADGTYTKNYSQTPNDELRNNLIKQQLGNLTLDNYNPKTSDYTYGSLLSDPTKSYNPVTVEDPTLNYNPSTIEDASLGYSTKQIVDPSVDYNTTILTDPSLSYKTQSIVDPTTGYSTSQLYGNINQGTADNAAQSYYDQATRLLKDQFDRERRSADTNLINRGIQVGSEQYNQVMSDLADRQNGTLSDIANQAVFQGQGLLSTMLGNQAQQTTNEGSEIANKYALLQNQNQLLANQGRQTANEGAEMANKNTLLQNQNQFLQNQGLQTANEGYEIANRGAILDNLSRNLQNQYQQTVNEGAEIGNKNALLQNQNQYLQNQALNTTNEGLVFDNQGKLINNQAGLLSNQGRQLSNEGQYYGNLGQILANQGQSVANEGNVLMNQYRNLANTGMDLSNAGQYYSNQGQQISNANALGSGRDVYGVGALSGTNDAYNDNYQSQVYRDAMRNERNSNVLSTLGALTGGALKGLF